MRAAARLPALLICLSAAAAPAEPPGGPPPAAKPRNILFILVDDQRYDAMSCMGHPFLKTPAADSLAAGGVRFANAFVTSSLCSPSRASILTGLYAHTHRVVDNQSEMPADLVLFPQLLQKAGYRTAFIGKWHMGHSSDKPQRGFDHWVGFTGQGSYFPDLPDGRKARLNVDGRSVEQTGYITDELTDYALKWLADRTDGRPWMLYLSHKAVHHDFQPAPRHRGLYAKAEVTPFPTTQGTPRDELRPMWARNQRNSWHGAEFPFHGSLGKTEDLYRRYCETLLAVDESTRRLIDHLRAAGRLDDTLIVYMGDNGHLWGEHGLIDKRTAYEPSIRVPLLMHCPALLPKGRVVTEMAAGIDIAPTVLEAAGIAPPAGLHGRSLLPAARGDKSAAPPRTELLYEYFWERWAPATPTLHALITPRWKYVRAYGLWDVPELYDLQDDPHELENLFRHPDHHRRALDMDKRLFELLRETGGEAIPLSRGWNGSAKELRDPAASGWAPFPKSMTAPSKP
jgi:N-acetylglucosamine-6-sulfatase